MSGSSFRVAAAALGLLLATCGEGTVPAVARRPDGSLPPNILLISFDTLRTDRLGVYGNDDWDRTTSPEVDALAGRGVRFTAASTPRGQTRPSLGAMLSGKYPITTGLRENSLSLLPEHRTVFEHLHDGGWHVGIFLSNFLLERPRGADGPIEQVWAYRGADVKQPGQQRGEAAEESRAQRIWDDRVEQAALAFLDAADAERPFALWVHFYDIHKPFNPPEGYDRYGHAEGLPEVLRAPGPGSGGALEEHLREITLGERELPAAELRRILGLYDGTVTATDARLGRLLDKLAAVGAADNTYVVFTADHGEELFDRNRYFFHGNSIHAGVLRLPLVVTGPGLPSGAVVDTPVQNLDLAPTLLELAGLPIPGEMEGRSLAGLLRGTTTEAPRPHSFHEWQDVVYGVSDGSTKLLFNPRHAVLQKEPYFQTERGFPVRCIEGYDQHADPGELQDLLAHEDPARLLSGGLPPPYAELHAALQRWLAEPQHEREMSWPGLSEAALEQMRQLGYVGGDKSGTDYFYLDDCGAD